jgi:transcriptional regulator with XRE-family HTH domain
MRNAAAESDATPMPGDGRSGLGERLREARLEQGIGLRSLARRLELSASLLSQIEHGKIEPSVRTLYALVTELGVSFDDMFSSSGAEDGSSPEAQRSAASAEPAAPVPIGERRGAAAVLRRGLGRALELESGVRWERLWDWPESELEVRRTTYPPGSSSSEEGKFVRHPGREFGLVLSGTLKIMVGFDEYELNEGDSITFDSTIPHRLHNEGADPVHALWIELNRYAE